MRLLLSCYEYLDGTLACAEVTDQVPRRPCMQHAQPWSELSVVTDLFDDAVLTALDTLKRAVDPGDGTNVQEVTTDSKTT